MIRSLPLVVLFACGPVPDAPEGDLADGFESTSSEAYVPVSDVEALVGPLVLAAGPVHPGGVVDVVVGNANAGEPVVLASSVGGLGNGPCPSWAGGLCLDLGGGTRLLTAAARANQAGVASFQVPVSEALVPGSSFTYQALVRRGPGGAQSEKSNAAVKTVGDPAWRGLVAVDGDLSDWTQDEWFGTTSQLGGAGVTWDADSLYVAFDHPDVASGGDLHWEVVYIGTGGPGSTTGPTIGTQTPTLPFAADLVVRRKADGSYDDVLRWDVASGQWLATPGAFAQVGWASWEAGQALEMAIPRSELSYQLEVALAQVYEGAGFESTYAGVPATAFADGYDPDLADALVLDLSSPDSPVVQNP